MGKKAPSIDGFKGALNVGKQLEKTVTGDITAVKSVVKSAPYVANWTKATAKETGHIMNPKISRESKIKSATHYQKHRGYKAGMIGEKALPVVGKGIQIGAENMKLGGMGLMIFGDPEVGKETGAALYMRGLGLQAIGKSVEKAGKPVAKVEHKIGDFVGVLAPKKKVKKEHEKHLVATNSTYNEHTDHESVGLKEITNINKSREHRAFIDTETGDIHLSFRGTLFDPTDAGGQDDLTADFHILTGTEDLASRFKRDQATFDELTAKYPNRKIHLSGHSLGAKSSHKLMLENCDKHDMEYVGFNLGSNPLVQDTSNHCTSKHSKMMTNYHTRGDAISLGSYSADGTTVVIRQSEGEGVLGPHGLENFKV